jgi:hypothetical protein
MMVALTQFAFRVSVGEVFVRRAKVDTDVEQGSAELPKVFVRRTKVDAEVVQGSPTHVFVRHENKHLTQEVVVDPTGSIRRSNEDVIQAAPSFRCKRTDLALVGATGSLSTPASTQFYFGNGCESSCNIATDLECLPAEQCLLMDVRRARCNAAFAHEIRHAIRTRATLKNEYIDNIPVGKMLNYQTISDWETWIQDGTLTSTLLDTKFHTWIRRDFSDTIPYCKSRGLDALHCFLKPLEFEESDNDASERATLAEMVLPERDQLVEDVLRCRRKETCGNAAGRLLLFAQIARMRFVREIPLVEHYDASVVQLNHGAVGHLGVSLHMRRGDACFKGIREAASELEDPPQQSSSRYCYSTKIYAAKLKRLRQVYAGIGTVYLSTDDQIGNVLAEFEAVAPELFHQLNWRYLNVSRAAYSALEPHSFVENIPLADKPQVAFTPWRTFGT